MKPFALEHIASSGYKFCVDVYCKLCNKSSTLGFKNGKAILSNFTRHLTMSVEKRQSITPDNTLDNFFQSKANATYSSQVKVTSPGAYTDL